MSGLNDQKPHMFDSEELKCDNCAVNGARNTLVKCKQCQGILCRACSNNHAHQEITQEEEKDIDGKRSTRRTR